jgi:Tfp pilus assembly protein PilN
MPEQSEKTSIQLLPEKEFEEYPLSQQFTTWVIKVGRLIIIATELIAFAVFIGRIKLDRELTDLTNSLENQLTILENAREFEDDFRDVQQRLKVVKDLRQNQTPVGPTLSLFSSLLPEDVEVTELDFQTDEAYLLARTGSPTSFANTIYNLKQSPQIKDIALTSGRYGGGVYHFSLEIKF